MKNKRVISSIFFTLITFSLFANVRMPLLFSDGMVLQRNKSIPVWGWADANEKIEFVLIRKPKLSKPIKMVNG